MLIFYALEVARPPLRALWRWHVSALRDFRCRQRGSFLFLCLLDRFAVRETRNELEEQGAALVEIGKRVGVSPARSRQEMLLTPPMAQHLAFGAEHVRS